MEFGKKGYVKASTNTIVKAAGISKGMLFYYFNSKEELFKDLMEIRLRYIKEEYLEKISVGDTDFIEKYRMAGELKYKAYHQYPEVFTFLGNLYLEKDCKYLSPELIGEYQMIQKFGWSRLYEHTDYSGIRGDIPREEVIRLINWCMTGYEKNLEERFGRKKLSDIDLAPFWDDYYEFLDNLKTVFYKGE